MILHLTIPGPPRTKKNGGTIKMCGRIRKKIPSEAWMRWRDASIFEIRKQFAAARIAPIDFPINCAALFYRDAACGDACGFYQGLADLLEEAGVVADDKWITQWDGARLLKDSKWPRVELEITNTTPVGD
jgi:Holliday junction resolvase RusA-like endonuclease